MSQVLSGRQQPEQFVGPHLSPAFTRCSQALNPIAATTSKGRIIIETSVQTHWAEPPKTIYRMLMRLGELCPSRRSEQPLATRARIPRHSIWVEGRGKGFIAWINVQR